MKTISAKFLGISSVCGALLLASSLTVGAASDNEHWKQGQAELQKQLAPGAPVADYRKKIEGLGGSVSISSRIGRGSTISLRLPQSVALQRVLVSLEAGFGNDFQRNAR